MSPPSKPSEQCEIPGDERFLFRARPLLQLSLAPQRGGAGFLQLGVDQRNRPSPRGEHAGAPVAMLHEPALEIGRLADVESVVGAAEDVHEVHDDDDAIVDLWMPVGISGPFDSRPSTAPKGAQSKVEGLRAFDSLDGVRRALRLAPLAQGILPGRWLAMSEPSACGRQDEGESNGGGGGSRTRVRKHIPAGLYMRVCS